MTDIVERLRAFKVALGGAAIVMDEAADEIERLEAYVEEWKRRYETARSAHEEGRAEIERLRQGVEVVAADICVENDNLQAENERLRAALGRLVNDSMYKDHPEASQMAIDALERKP